jgi:hypothetical protein
LAPEASLNDEHPLIVIKFGNARVSTEAKVGLVNSPVPATERMSAVALTSGGKMILSTQLASTGSPTLTNTCSCETDWTTTGAPTKLKSASVRVAN